MSSVLLIQANISSPFPSPPPRRCLDPFCKDVAAWARANPSSIRTTRVVDDVDMPALKSTRNALGVLAGGGEADLTEAGSEEVCARVIPALSVENQMVVLDRRGRMLGALFWVAFFSRCFNKRVLCAVLGCFRRSSCRRRCRKQRPKCD